MDAKFRNLAEEFLRQREEKRAAQIAELKKKPNTRAAIGSVFYEVLADQTINALFAEQHLPDRIVIAYFHKECIGYDNRRSLFLGYDCEKSDPLFFQASYDPARNSSLNFRKHELQAMLDQPALFKDCFDLQLLLERTIVGASVIRPPGYSHICKSQYDGKTFNGPILEAMIQDALGGAFRFYASGSTGVGSRK